MKCLHILPMNKLSGAEKMALILCRNMKSYEPVVVCGGEELKEVFEQNGIKSYALSFSPKRLLLTLSQLKKIIKENDIKIIHAHDNNASLNAYFVKTLYRLDIKVISHIHSCYPFLKENTLNKKIDSFFRPRYDFNIACGNLVYDFYINNTKYIKKERLKAISNAIDIKEINTITKEETEEVRYKFNIPKDKVIIGFSGRICKIKGIIPFIKEFSKVKDDFLDCRILLVGSGEQEKEIIELLERLNIKELFILTGFQKDMYAFYPLIDIFFLPSLYEGLPMVILEAMAFKKAVVSMNVGSINEVIDNCNGILVKPGDYEEFVVSIKQIKNDKKLIKSYGEKGYNFINTNYNICSYVKEIETQYDNII